MGAAKRAQSRSRRRRSGSRAAKTGRDTKALPSRSSVLKLHDAAAGAFAAIAGPALWALFDPEYDPRLGLVIWLVAFPIVWVVLLWLVGAHEPGASPVGRRAITAVAQALFLVGVALLVIFFLRPFFVPRGSSLLSLAIVYPATIAGRAFFDRHAGARRGRTAVVLGTDRAALRAAEAAIATPAGLRIVAFLEEHAEPAARISDRPLLDLRPGLWARVRELGAATILVGHTSRLSASTLGELSRCFEHGVEAVPAAAYFESLTGRVMADALEADWYADLPTRSRGVYPVVKRGVDLLLATLLGVVALPIGAVVALAVYLDSGGPVMLRQVRVGRRGERFVVHKFRSMRHGAEVEGQPVWASVDDERRTRVGRFLRARRVDELPQLWDVLRGAMSLIGPRPERPEFSEKLVAELPLYAARALVRPGITGWAQVRFPYAATVEENLAKLEYDLYYVRHFGPLLDLAIAIRTLLILLGVGSAPARERE